MEVPTDSASSVYTTATARPRRQYIVLVHLMGDPIGTVKDLREKSSRCEEHAVYFENHNVRSRNSDINAKDGRLFEAEWKTLAMICVAYDEWGEGYLAQEALGKHL